MEHENNYDEEMRRIGEPFYLDAYIAVSATKQYFTLGGGDDTGTDYDLDGDGTDDTAPFNNKMLAIYSMEVIAPTAGSASVGVITIDNRCILNEGGTIAGGASLLFAGRNAPTDLRPMPHLHEVMGGPVYCRRRIGILAPSTDEIENTVAWCHVKLWGFMVDRRF